MARVFISYAHKDDSAFFEELKSNLQISEIDFWTDENIPPAEKWISEIEANLSQSFALIVIATKNSIDRDWIHFEWAYALGMQIKVIVIKIDEITLPDPLPFIQNISKPQSPLEWNQLIQVLRKHRNETWLRYWIPTQTPTLIRCALQGLVETDDSDELNAFMTILSKHRNKYSVKALSNGLSSPDVIIRAKSAWTLGTIRDVDTVEPLLDALIENTESVVIAHIIGALGDIGDKRAVPYLSSMLRNQSVFSSLTRQPYRQDTISNQALVALNLIGTPEALAAIEAWKQENKPM